MGRVIPAAVCISILATVCSGPREVEEGGEVARGEKGDVRLWLCVHGGDLPAVNADATLEHGQEARLGVVVRWGDGWYSDLGRVAIDGKEVQVRPMDDLDGWRTVRWYKVESAEASYKNSDRNDGWWADVEYVETLDSAGRQTVRMVDVRPLERRGLKWEGRYVGTMRFKVEVDFGDFVISTPGKEPVGRGGVVEGMRRVSRRGGTGNEIVDHAMSLANLPYIWGSAPVGVDPSSHQAEMYIGADCADLVVASWRMAGYGSIAYTAVLPMIDRYRGSHHGVEISRVEDGVYLDGAGGRIKVGKGGVEPGAAVAWTFIKGRRKGHAGLLVEDRGPGGKANGVFDENDLVLHAMWDTPAIERAGDVMKGLVSAAVMSPVEE